MKIDGFLVAMLAVVGLAFVWPELGASDGILPMSWITTIGIALIFFLHGANLSRQALTSGAANWRLHLFIQACTYVLFPLIGLALYLLTADLLPPEARIGIFFLCALSSTVSSSVAMTAMARGNVGAAVFNASLSGLLGMMLTPLFMGLVIGTSISGGQSVVQSILEIVLKLLIPFVLGHLARPLLANIIGRHKKLIGLTDRSVILLIVFASFCQSTANGLWTQYDPWMILAIVLLVSLLLAVVLIATRFLSPALGFAREDEIAAVFCGSYKSLANGAPIAETLFGGNPAMGMILLPLLIYHQLQILVCTVFAQRYAAGRKSDDIEGRTALNSAAV